jgi:hypothetical protein
LILQSNKTVTYEEQVSWNYVKFFLKIDVPFLVQINIRYQINTVFT